MKTLNLLSIFCAFFSINSAQATVYVSGTIQITSGCNYNQNPQSAEFIAGLDNSHGDLVSNRIKARIQSPDFKLTLSPGCTHFDNNSQVQKFVIDLENYMGLRIGVNPNDGWGYKYSSSFIRMGLYPKVTSDDAYGALAIDFDADRGKSFPFNVSSSDKGIRFEGNITLDQQLQK